MQSVFKTRLDAFYDLINDIPGIQCSKPHGAFYIFPNMKKVATMTSFSTVEELVEALLEEEKVALVPGTGFGAPDFVCLSYAPSMDVVVEASTRMKRLVQHRL